MNSLGAGLERVLREYAGATKEPFAGHPLATFLRSELPEALRQFLPEGTRLIVEGSAGKGRWARSPWLAVFDPLITTSAQEGFYPVYLVSEDSQRIYLSLNQGVTIAREQYKADAKDVLRARAHDFRLRTSGPEAAFPLTQIDLSPSGPSNDSAFYEAGNIFAKEYKEGSIPSDERLAEDLRRMLKLYGDLVEIDLRAPASADGEDDEPAGAEDDASYQEDLRRLRVHKRLERNSKLARKGKRLHGYTCALCSFNFLSFYGPLGEGYIEAHHLKPLSTLKGQVVEMDPKRDFAVLCANCHRMVHRSGKPHDLEGFRKEHLDRTR